MRVADRRTYAIQKIKKKKFLHTYHGGKEPSLFFFCLEFQVWVSECKCLKFIIRSYQLGSVPFVGTPVRIRTYNRVRYVFALVSSSCMSALVETIDRHPANQTDNNNSKRVLYWHTAIFFLGFVVVFWPYVNLKITFGDWSFFLCFHLPFKKNCNNDIWNFYFLLIFRSVEFLLIKEKVLQEKKLSTIN